MIPIFFFISNCDHLAGLDLASLNNMKSFIKNGLNVSHQKLTILVVVMGVLSLFYNNCAQNGEIAFSASPSKTSPADLIPSDLQNEPNPVASAGVARFKKIISNLDLRSIPNNKVDILIVMDNSRSMDYEQQEMAQRFSGFIQSLNGLDWQLGLTTTDPANNKGYSDGRLIKLYRKSFILNSKQDTDFATEMFSEAIQREGDDGSPNEQGVRAIFRAVQRTELPEKQDTTFNRKLFREDASLAIVVVSDADETSASNNLSAYNRPENLLLYIRQKWPQKVLTIHSIIVKSDDISCLEYPQSINEAYGKAYEFLSRQTSGIIGSVCESDYAGQLKIMGQDIKDKVKSIPLNCSPADANNDGRIDFSLKNSQGIQITDYTLASNIVMLPDYLPPGRYELEYTCKE